MKVHCVQNTCQKMLRGLDAPQVKIVVAEHLASSGRNKGEVGHAERICQSAARRCVWSALRISMCLRAAVGNMTELECDKNCRAVCGAPPKHTTAPRPAAAKRSCRAL